MSGIQGLLFDELEREEHARPGSTSGVPAHQQPAREQLAHEQLARDDRVCESTAREYSNPFYAATRRVSFDIEIANVFELAPGEDLEAHGPFDISVAAISNDAGEAHHWYARDPAGSPTRHIDRELAREVLESLRAAQQRGIHVCAWNGMSFDARWLGHAAGDMQLAAEVALDLYDPMFQFVGRRGFPVSLAAVAEGLGIGQKKLMSGADAPKEWARGNHQVVLDYVAGDCRITHAVIDRIATERQVRWKTRKGTIGVEPFPELLRVRDVMRGPEPDTSWMSDPKPWSSWFGWVGAARAGC